MLTKKMNAEHLNRIDQLLIETDLFSNKIKSKKAIDAFDFSDEAILTDYITNF